MINDGINNVPDKTIAIFPYSKIPNENLKKDTIIKILQKSPKKRDWFDSHFYRCLPLTIGNQYGYTISSEFDISFEWDGRSDNDSIKFYFNEENKILENKYPRIESHFGHGIITINPPFFLRTPPGVNLMTINPPNFIIPNITVMTGVVETDNLRRNFTFNIKIQIPNIRVNIPAGLPIAAFIPVPRYYCDDFKLEFAEDIFDKDIVNEENQAAKEADAFRDFVEPTLKNGVGRHYFLGKDIYGNEFKDHQKP